MAGGQDLHPFISSGFLTLGRGHLKGKVHPLMSVMAESAAPVKHTRW